MSNLARSCWNCVASRLIYTTSSHMQNLLIHTLIYSKRNNIFNKFIHTVEKWRHLPFTTYTEWSLINTHCILTLNRLLIYIAHFKIRLIYCSQFFCFSQIIYELEKYTDIDSIYILNLTHVLHSMAWYLELSCSFPNHVLLNFALRRSNAGID